MDNKRNCITALADYISSKGININIGKTKARGNRGFFTSKSGNYRIDISSGLDENAVISTLLHEFAHYIHYKQDKTLASLAFVFGELSDLEMEELLGVTVRNVPKSFAASLYEMKDKLSLENKHLLKQIKDVYPDFKVSGKNRNFEYSLLFNFQHSNLYTSYLKFKSNQRNITRINAKINRLNKYYNQPSELWARYFELFFINRTLAEEIAPQISAKFVNVFGDNLIKEISDIIK